MAEKWFQVRIDICLFAIHILMKTSTVIHESILKADLHYVIFLKMRIEGLLGEIDSLLLKLDYCESILPINLNIKDTLSYEIEEKSIV